MGQKVDPNMLRLGLTQGWKTRFLEKKSSELSDYLFEDLELARHIRYFFRKKGLNLFDYKFHRNSSVINVSLSYIAATYSSVHEKQARTSVFLLRDSSQQLSRSSCRFKSGANLKVKIPASEQKVYLLDISRNDLRSFRTSSVYITKVKQKRKKVCKTGLLGNYKRHL